VNVNFYSKSQLIIVLFFSHPNRFITESSFRMEGVTYPTQFLPNISYFISLAIFAP